MTSQSMPISKTRKDYGYSAIALVLIAIASALGVYLTRPNAIIMRQPRMTIVVAVGVIVLVTAFIFIARSAQPFYSRVLSYSIVCVSFIFLFAMGFFTDDGRTGGWFRFAVLCFFITAGLTLLTELMVQYRRLVAKKPFKNHIVHRVIFALVCGLIAATSTFFYYEKGVGGGAILDYGVRIPTEQLQTELPDNLQNLSPNSIPEDITQSTTENPDTPVATEAP